MPVRASQRTRDALARLDDSERVTWQHYRIRRGDSLIRIAQRFDTRVDLLRAVNHIDGNLIRAGDTMMIPNSAAWQESLAMATQGGGTISTWTATCSPGRRSRCTSAATNRRAAPRAARAR